MTELIEQLGVRSLQCARMTGRFEPGDRASHRGQHLRSRGRTRSPPNKALELTGPRSAYQGLQLPAAGGARSVIRDDSAAAGRSNLVH